MSDVQSKGSEAETLEVSSNRENFLKVASKACYAYLPVAGSVSCLVFTTHMTNPRILQSVFAPYEQLMANAFLLNSHVGLGVYFYSRKHMQLVARPWRVVYSVCGSVLFNLGNVMFCAVTKVLLPRIDLLRTVFGIASGVMFLTIAGRYLQFVDDNISNTT